MIFAAQTGMSRRTMIYAVVLLAGLGYLLYDYVYMPRAEEVAALEQRLEALRLQNRAARSVAAGGGAGDVESQLAAYREQLEVVERLIPSSEEVPDLLDAISMEARRTGVELSLIQPVGASNEGYYTRRIYELAVLGPYHRTAEFLTRIASLPRIITPTDLNVTVHEPGGPGEEPHLEVRFSIETYVLPDLLPSADTLSSDTPNAE